MESNNNNSSKLATNGHLGSSLNIKNEAQEHTMEAQQHPNQKIHLVTTSSPDTSITTVPVSLSVGGTSFNVITNPEGLPHFKQVLCVDNNTFLTDITSAGSGGNAHNQDIKTIVIQQPGDHHHHHNHNTIVTTSAPSNHNNSITTIIDAANLGVSTGSNNSQDGSLLNDSSSSSNNQVATTIVVPNSSNLSSVKVHNDNFITAELLNGDVIPIRCKTTNAELYKSKLGSGGRGRCIKCKEQWYTPSEFEQMCGRGSSKDWKRSIRYGGRSLQALIDGGVITPHATNCSCSACADDDLVATGPVRLFTPYKRRKRNQVDREMENAKKRKNGVSGQQTVRSTNIPVSSTTISAATITAPTVETGTVLTGLTTATTIGSATITTGATLTDISQSQQYQEGEEIISFKHDTGTIRNRIESWPNLNDSLDEATVEFFDNGSSHPFIVLETGSYVKQLESAYSTIVRATNDFKKIFVEYRESCNRKIDQLQTERDLLAARVSSTEIDEQSVANAMAGNEIVSPKRCANCNREALAECSLCRSTPYCSTFCQRKDWNSHQVQCNREPVEATQQIMLLVEDQS